MSWWDRALNGGHEAPPARPPSTPAPTGGDWYPTPQYRPPDRWAVPAQDPIQVHNGEVSAEIAELLEGGTGTIDARSLGAKYGTLAFDTPLGQAIADQALSGKSKAMKREPHRCPSCGDPRYFQRTGNTVNGFAPAPMCMACSYTGERYSISELN